MSTLYLFQIFRDNYVLMALYKNRVFERERERERGEGRERMRERNEKFRKEMGFQLHLKPSKLLPLGKVLV